MPGVKLCNAPASNATKIYDAVANSSVDHDVAATAAPLEEDQFTYRHNSEDTAAINESPATKGKYH